MHAQNFLVASTVLLPVLVQAHGGGIPGAPKIFGRRSALQDKAFQAVRDRSERAQPYGEPPNEHTDLKRQASTNTGGQCGPSYGSCADGYCCSEAGWCGSGTSYCMSPGTIAVTFDDGPYIYTDYILDVLANYSAKATFFVTGNNNGKGEIDNAANPWATVIKRAYNEGHQIASHTWTHPYLSNLTSLQRRQQMWSNEMALRNVLGFFPTYMRPPYSDCTAASGCESDMAELGYHITYFDVDTDDYANDSPLLIQNAKNNFNAGIAGGSPSTSDYLVIAHDIHNQTAHNLTAYMLQTLLAQGYKPVTVGECLGDPEANWYRNSSGSVFTSTTAIATSTTAIKSTVAPTATSTDATCGGSSGFTCSNSAFGNCCSASGWCGSGDLYCGEGCQAGFGTCGINVASLSSSAAATTTTTKSALPSTSKSSSSSTSSAAASPTAVSTDASCGGTTGFTCQGSTFGNCCSKYGFCGSTNAYCGTDCQSGFGTCGVSSVSSSSSSARVTQTSATSVSANKAASTTSKKAVTSSTSTKISSKTTSTSTSAKTTATAKTAVTVKPASSKTTSAAKLTIASVNAARSTVHTTSSRKAKKPSFLSILHLPE
ncbi:hypothetical protein MBLNU459_g1983t2 [Dothideomycetes sp. NU459]